MKKFSQNVRNAFESILRADYVNVNDINQLSKLDDYYVDFYKNTSSLLQRQDNYISGRRGTGKTALLLKGYFECLKTISKRTDKRSEIVTEDKILPIYIDLSNCRDIINDNDVDLLEMHFVKQIVESLKIQLELIFEEKFISKFKENPSLDDLSYIEEVLVNGITLSNFDRTTNEKLIQTDSGQLGFNLAPTQLSACGTVEETHSRELTTSNKEIRGLNVQDFLNRIDQIRKKAQIDYIYVFVDEFSDLNTNEQDHMAKLIRKFLGSKVNMFFKIGVITDRYSFGDKIIIGRDLYHIPLDFNDFVERYGGIVTGLRKLESFVNLLVNKRLEIYCGDTSYSDVFKMSKSELINRLSRASMGVPRSIGLILQNAWLQSDQLESSDPRIGIQELNYGIKATKRTYYSQFAGSAKKKLIPAFYMDMWNEILGKALKEKSSNPHRPASHILLDPTRKEYLNILCENFLVHHLEDDRTSKYGGNYLLYALDYEVCRENNIIYAEHKDEFTSFRFIYDNVVKKFDPYFLKDNLKSYRCNTCGRMYDESEVVQFKFKRCFEDDSLLEEIIHKSAPISNGNLAELEIKILGMISSLEYEDAMTAQEIADAVGCSRQKVALWGSRVLHQKGLINVIKGKGKQKYYSSDD